MQVFRLCRACAAVLRLIPAVFVIVSVKVALGASSLFGTISGSVVSNVVMDGPITIPMMVRTGYKRHIAAAIEAVASTGGQIMPPVMGITAFLIADFLGT